MFRFTIRDLLWLTALVAVRAAWFLDSHSTRQQAADERDAATLLRADNTQLEIEKFGLSPKSTAVSISALKLGSPRSARWWTGIMQLCTPSLRGLLAGSRLS